MSKRFRLEFADKNLLVFGPTLVCPLAIDYDDVDHPEVERVAKSLVNILNEHWPEGEK